MIRCKAIAFAMAVLMLQPVLLSCSADNRTLVVKENDPWYESHRFKLTTDKRDTEMLESSVVAYSEGRLYHLYCLTDLADYDSYRRSVLDTYDEDGKLLDSVILKETDNYEICGIRSIRAEEESNTLMAVAEVFATGGFETAVLKIDLNSGETNDVKPLKNSDGKTLEIGDGKNSYGVAEVSVAGNYIIPVIYTGDTAGSTNAHAYSFNGSEYLCELDFSGIPSIYRVEDFSFDPRNNTLFTVGYSRSDGPVVLEFDADTGRRINYEKYNQNSQSKVNLSDYKCVDSGELCKIDMLGNITAYDAQTQEVKTVIDNTWYTPYFSDLKCDDLRLVTCSSEEAVIYSKKETGYTLFFSGVDETVTILRKSDRNPHAGKKIIELATPTNLEMTEYLSDAIYEFNKTDKEYLIRVWSKYKEGIVAGRSIAALDEEDEKLFTMIQELNGPDAPDVAIGIQKNYAMRDNIFEDLTGYLDQSVMDKQFANVIEAARINGKQYFLPVTLEIEGLVVDRSLITSGACGITFEEYEHMIEDELDGFSPYDYPLSEYYYKMDFLLSCINTKAAIEGANADFGTEQFYAAVEYSNEIFAEEGFAKSDEELSWADEMKRSRTACRYDRIGNYLDFVHACESDEGDYAMIGTPSVDASGPRFRAVETISVTTKSDVKDGCRKFLNFLFSGAGYSNSDRVFQDIVTNKEIMENNVGLTAELNNTGYHVDQTLNTYMSGLEDYGLAYGYKCSTKSMEKSFMDSLATISIYYYDDPVITAFLIEEIAPYYAGDRTLDETVKILNDRVNKYIKEM